MMTLSSTVVVVILGVLLCCVDGIRQKRGNWDLGLNYAKNNGGNARYGAKLGYEKNGFNAGLNYGGTKGYDRFGGSIGYKGKNFRISGNGFKDSTGNWGAGASVGWRFKRSAPVPKELYFLSIHVDVCQFIVYDRNADGIITIDEVQEIFPASLANSLFSDLDENDNGEVSLDEFNDTSTTVIAECRPEPGSDDDE